jgi:hypothetical protein
MQLPSQIESMATLVWTLIGPSDRRTSDRSVSFIQSSTIVFSRYDKARQIKEKQDAYCSAALAGQWTALGEFPEDLQWEALVDVLRGRVRVLRFPVFVGSSHSESFLILRFKHTVTKPSTWMT